MRHIFLEKSHTKFGESIPRCYTKKSKLSISLDFIQFVFNVCQVEDYRNIMKLSCRSLVFSSYKFFSKEKRSGGSLPVSFSA